MKYVINTQAGGFGLSAQAQIKLYQRGSTAIRAVPNRGFSPVSADDLRPVPDYPGFLMHPRYDMVFTPEGELLQESFAWDMSWRTCPILVALVEEDAQAARGSFARLKVVEVPDDVPVELCRGESGAEWLAEVHRTWM